MKLQRLDRASLKWPSCAKLVAEDGGWGAVGLERTSNPLGPTNRGMQATPKARTLPIMPLVISYFLIAAAIGIMLGLIAIALSALDRWLKRRDGK
jgi:hypothetical protein